ncbi:MAG: hypothetical protein Q7S66_00485 [bacterium]|nr:hypothetical protein [bacterium]
MEVLEMQEYLFILLVLVDGPLPNADELFRKIREYTHAFYKLEKMHGDMQFLVNRVDPFIGKTEDGQIGLTSAGLKHLQRSGLMEQLAKLFQLVSVVAAGRAAVHADTYPRQQVTEALSGLAAGDPPILADDIPGEVPDVSDLLCVAPPPDPLRLYRGRAT